MADQPTSTVRKGRTRTASTKSKPRGAAAKTGVSVKGTDGEVTTIAANEPAAKRSTRAKTAAARSTAKPAAQPAATLARAFPTSWFDAMTSWQKSFAGAFGDKTAAMPDPTDSLQAMQKAWFAPMQAFSGAFGGKAVAMPDPTEGLKAMQQAWWTPIKAMRDTWSKPAGAFPTGMAADAWEYWVDAAQRQVLYWDTMRQRGNIFLEHKEKGKPPVLDFDYEMLIDGRTLERPVNYALVRIIPDEGMTILPEKRPYVIVDPRAGHGPGIGGFKKSSQIGVAMRDGHPAYFVTFFPDPEPGQTLFDIGKAEALFLEEVARRHPNAKKPVVIGNCQAGWAVAMLSAAAPEVTGPIVLNGAPLSYWAGADGKNPMRYTGGLLGGTWLATLASDLGNGIFDGA